MILFGQTISWSWVAGYYVTMTFVTLVLYAWDKSAAQRGADRVRERTLHLSSLAGGFAGAFAGQAILRHKTRHAGFAVVAWLALLVHAAAWIGWWMR